MESLRRHFKNSKTACDAYLGHTYQKYLNPFGDPVHRVHRVATAAFWRTFSHEGKIGPGW
jgi:hypothetical protein